MYYMYLFVFKLLYIENNQKNSLHFYCKAVLIVTADKKR